LRADLTKESLDEVVNQRRRQQRSLDTRERILEAAFEEFADRGFEGASTRSVAAKAGVQHPLVTYHFQNKEGLWRAVISNASFNFSRYFQDHFAELHKEDDVGRLRRLQEEFIRFAAANPNFHWLMSNEGKRETERLTWLVEERVRSYFDVVAKLIVAAQKQGRYVEGDPYHLQYLFIGAVTRIFMLAAEVQQVMGRSPFSKKTVEEHVRICCDLFFREPGVRKAKSSPLPKSRGGRTQASRKKTTKVAKT
jgi:TetR/AcrR family transcriptional regulator